METIVLVALYRLGQVQLVTNDYRDLIVIRNPYIIEFVCVVRRFSKPVINTLLLQLGIRIMACCIGNGLTEDITASGLVYCKGITIGVSFRMIGMYRRREIYIVADLGLGFRIIIRQRSICNRAGRNLCVEGNVNAGIRMQCTTKRDDHTVFGVSIGDTFHFNRITYLFSFLG